MLWITYIVPISVRLCSNEILINVSDNISDLLNNYDELITSFGEGDFENSGYNLGLIIKKILGFYVY